ncbi:MAG: tRNA epoxyqueuosine(34) reductase QueG, partial [Alphaproteobacteria bacterium]|nr:tRNA epoxyqueuosine(34) reductase QueG [Alphaproteobacteria bacterium]
SREARLQARPELDGPALADLVQLDDAGFRALFAGSPIKRIGLARFLRNVLIAIGNSGDVSLLPLVEARLGDSADIVRGAAIWALRRLDAERAGALRPAALAGEQDDAVAAEWTGELA